MAENSYYAEEILKLIKEAEADGYHVYADWEFISVGDLMYGSKTAIISYDSGWELGK